MKELYIVYEFETLKFTEDEIFEEKWYVTVDGKKIYKPQFEELMLLENDVVVVTSDSTKVDYWKQKIREFYDSYRKAMKQWDIGI